MAIVNSHTNIVIGTNMPMLIATTNRFLGRIVSHIGKMNA
jgi:hypothetical protein